MYKSAEEVKWPDVRACWASFLFELSGVLLSLGPLVLNALNPSSVDLGAAVLLLLPIALGSVNRMFSAMHEEFAPSWYVSVDCNFYQRWTVLLNLAAVLMSIVLLILIVAPGSFTADGSKCFRLAVLVFFPVISLVGSLLPCRLKGGIALESMRLAQRRMRPWSIRHDYITPMLGKLGHHA